MIVLKNKKISLLALIVIPLLILGCSGKKDEEVSLAEEIKINQGSILKYDKDKYNLYNYEDENYKLNKTNESIIAYDKKSSNYLYVKDKNYYVVHNGEKREVKDEKFTDIKIAPNGKYISYFIEKEGLNLKIFEVSKNKEIKINSKVSISGVLCDWYDENSIIYYGVSDEGLNGIYLYNLDNNKEELIYKVDNGYLGFIKALKSNIVFLQIDLDNNKKLMKFDKDNNEVKLLTDKIELLNDVTMREDEVYFSGKMYNDKESIYKIYENKIKRIVYDFPESVEVNKGITISEDGNVLFMGRNIKTKDKSIYSYSRDGTVNLLTNSSGEYEFIKFNN